jgi:hypothetical protein
MVAMLAELDDSLGWTLVNGGTGTFPELSRIHCLIELLSTWCMMGA